MSNMFSLDLEDLKRGLITAALAGFFLPVFAAFQTPGFDVFSANWQAIFSLAINGALTGLVAYLSKNFFTDSSGKFGGVI
jgi:hypothetical protein